jgi:formylmethanofuran dehydrogenase subunit B
LSASAHGRPCSLEEAQAAAAALLSKAHLPLVFGLTESVVEAQREAVYLARALRAVIHPGGPPMDTRFGALTTTLGEMRRRADLVVLWGCDPEASHPGFLEAWAPARAGRTRLAVELGAGSYLGRADEHLVLPVECELEALVVLRAFVRGRRVEIGDGVNHGLPIDALRALAQRLRHATYGVFVTQGDPPPERRNPLRAEVLTRLCRDARGHARLRGLTLRSANATGAEQVMTWLTGFPAAVSFLTGEAHHDPYRFTAETVLAERGAEAALVVGADPARLLSPPALAHLSSIPVVAIGGGYTGAAVAIETEPLASTPGHAFRSDGLVLRQAAATSSLPAEAEVLRGITARLVVETAA